MPSSEFKQRLTAALAGLFIGLLLAIAPGAGAQVALPDIGDSSGSVLSRFDERALGEAFMREVRRQVTIIDDPEVTEYIQNLGYRLASHTGEADRGFTFFVVQDRAINAFAAPGGFVGVNSGLILAAESESELAAVLAHEIAHITQHHIARMFQVVEATTIPAVAGLLAALLLGAAGSPDAGAAAATAISAGAAQVQIDTIRTNEKEADRVGIQILANADFDPRAMPLFFEKLQESYRYYSEPPEFLSTHPVTGSRIADSRNRAERYPYRQYADSLAYQLVRAKLDVTSAENSAKAAARYADKIQTIPEGNKRTAARYGYALAAQAAGRLDEARRELRRLYEADRDRVTFIDALARVELASGRTEQALSMYREALRLYTHNSLLTRGYADALLKAGQPREVLRLIENFRTVKTLDAPMYRLYALAHERAGNSVAAHAALAEHHYLQGQLDLAIHQLRLAAQAPGGDYYREASVHARLKQLEEEQSLRARN